MAYSITYNGVSSSDLNVKIPQRPNIPVPERDIEEIEIAGRDGVLIEDKGRYKPIEVSITLNFKANPDEWAEKLREIKSWLLSTDSVDEDGNMWLQFSDDDEWEYKVLNVTIDTVERAVKRTGSMNVTFLCDPYMYSIAGQEWQEFLYYSSDDFVTITLIIAEDTTATVTGDYLFQTAGSTAYAVYSVLKGSEYTITVTGCNTILILDENNGTTEVYTGTTYTGTAEESITFITYISNHVTVTVTNNTDIGYTMTGDSLTDNGDDTYTIEIGTSFTITFEDTVALTWKFSDGTNGEASIIATNCTTKTFTAAYDGEITANTAVGSNMVYADDDDDEIEEDS